MIRLWWAGVLLALALTGTAPATPAVAADGGPSPAALHRMQAAMDAMVADGVPGMYVQIRQGGRVTELRSGRPDLTSDRAWTQRSRFRVASVAKTFMAAVVMQLVAEGRLRLSDPVERWLPGRFPYGGQVTVRQLLNHTSGVPPYESLEFITEQYDQPDRRLTAQQLLGRVDGVPLLFTPGTAAAYSNTGYVMLARIVEEVTGQSYDTALRRRILAPLRLTDTSFEVDRFFPAPRVRGYDIRPGTTGPVLEVTTMNPTYAWGAGNLVSSGRDITVFMRAVLKGAVVPRQQLAQMQVVDPVTLDESGAGYGLGLETHGYPCAHYGKNGNVPGYVTIAESTVDGRRQVVWAANGADWLLRPGEPVLFIEVRTALGQLLCDRP
jgi:D-alanyl-D-alanine carboxypeptidase